jgi:hypothetical protein
MGLSGGDFGDPSVGPVIVPNKHRRIARLRDAFDKAGSDNRAIALPFPHFQESGP